MKQRKLSFWQRLSYFFHPAVNTEEVVFSPDRRIQFKFILKQGHVSYSVLKDNKILVKESRLGISIKNDVPFGERLTLVRTRARSFDENWETVWGEERVIRNKYNEKIFYLEENSGKKRLITIKIRIFDDGVAFRYEIPPQPSFSRIVIDDELTEFNLDHSGDVWEIPAYQPDRYEYNYERRKVFELENSVHTPLTVHSPHGYYLSIHEAALYDYGEMTLKLNEWKVLYSDITPLSDGAKAYVELPFSTPWRVIMIADSAISLVKNHMILNLNDPPRSDFSWVKPMKFMGIWWAMYVGEWTWAPGERHGATTEHMIEYLKSCKSLGLDGVLAEGWNNGWEGDWLQNGAFTDFSTPTKDFDIKRIANFAKVNGLDLVGHNETVGFIDNYENQLDEAYKFYSENDVNYVKTGYAGSMMTIHGNREWHHSQLGVRHYQKSVEIAAKYHICIDMHEPIKGTGIERTFPNLLTREGARGQEYEGGSLLPSHATILPFTRLLSGGMDYTSGIFDLTNSVKRVYTTLARQLAYFVVIPSGMQMVADRPRFYEIEKPDAYKFIRDVPVNWETTLPIMGEIGEYYVVARKGRGTEEWFIGGVTNEKERKLKFSLSFLDDGDYIAEAYLDAENAHYRDNPLAMQIKKWGVTRNTNLDIFVAEGGGFAIRIYKKA
ncbi:glycoside hydrolase family 97 protein [Candidatus Saccharibacteria bacterium]|nr:glycoside hydrolase family 97 protein [Candidatus Saccharibacteria bacterium]